MILVVLKCLAAIVIGWYIGRALALWRIAHNSATAGREYGGPQQAGRANSLHPAHGAARRAVGEGAATPEPRSPCGNRAAGGVQASGDGAPAATGLEVRHG